MNVAREIAAANRRVQVQIDRGAREALIRIGVDVDAEDRARRAAAAATGAEALGQAWRSLVDGMAAFAAAFARGFNGDAR